MISKTKIKQSIAMLFLILFLGGGLGIWLYFRKLPISIKDVIPALLGVGSVLWIVFWAQTKYVRRHSLFVPYLPIFLISGITMIGGSTTVFGIKNNFQMWSSYDTMNTLIWYLVSFMGTVVMLSLTQKSKSKKSEYLLRAKDEAIKEYKEGKTLHLKKGQKLSDLL